MTCETVILGMGAVLPQGEGDAALDRVLDGRCAAEARRFGDETYVVARVPEGVFESAPNDDRAVAMAVVAAEKALADAGLLDAADGPPSALRLPSGVGRDRVACLVGLSKGGLDLMARAVGVSGGADGRVARDWMGRADAGAAARAIAMRFGLCGAAFAPITACASGGHALSRARSLILDGKADVVVCGAADASLHPAILASYRRLGLLAPVRENPVTICRPFAVDRCGFYVGEGTAVFVVASRELAELVGKRPRSQLAACAEGAFATDLVTVPDDGVDLAGFIRVALDRARLSPRDVDLVGVHGTATRDGDLNEARALRRALGSTGCKPSVLVTKALHGHLLGAACAVESALVVRAMETGRVPQPDGVNSLMDDCQGLFDLQVPVEDGLSTAIKLSAGFGGQVSVNVFLRT